MERYPTNQGLGNAQGNCKFPIYGYFTAHANFKATAFSHLYLVFFLVFYFAPEGISECANIFFCFLKNREETLNFPTYKNCIFWVRHREMA